MTKHRPLTSAAPVPARVVAAALLTLLASACAGSASPGVGVRVGDETISASRIDDATVNMCTALSDRFEGQQVPMNVLKQGVVQLLALDAQAEQIAEDYDITPSGTYKRVVAENTRAASVMPEQVRTDYVEVMSAEALVTDVVEQVGRAKLVADGVAEPSVEQVGQAGSDVFRTWPDANGIEVNPKYGVELSDGALSPVDSSLSFAVSDEAKAGTAAEPDPAYADRLPSSQRCG